MSFEPQANFHLRLTISCPGSPDYEGHSLANLRRVAAALNARVRVSIESQNADM
ncbi:MAG: hypothetical protein IPG58_13270 [Acidobacteria bacterium]|nr:hypothetical protein [Acidobacteriota bacterium]